MKEQNPATEPDPAVVEKALARVEKDVLTAEQLQARAGASALLARMPDWWKEKLRVVAKTHFSCRKGRRATAKVLRDFASWERRNARTRARRTADKEARRLHLSRVLFDRAALGLPPPRGVSRDVVARIEGDLFEPAGDQA